MKKDKKYAIVALSMIILMVAVFTTLVVVW